MRQAKTVGFAIADEDRELLERLVEHYGAGNRSEFLRVAMKRMEHERIAQRLMETREIVDRELGGKVFSEVEIADLIREVTERD